MKISEITPYQHNRAYFDDMQGEDFEDLKKSIAEHGIIGPIIVNQDNVIICGHQRFRACLELGIDEIPVVVRNVKDDDEHETLLIEENLRRRQLSTSSMARAIKRLYEIRGIDGQGNRGDLTCATVAQVAKDVGKSERTIKTLRTIADLIPELSAMLDARAITQKVAYQLAQMDEEGQRLVHDHIEAQTEGVTIQEAAAKEFKDKYNGQQVLTQALQTKIDVLESQLPTDEILKKIADLENQLEAERNKKPEEIEIIPEDYEKTKEALKTQKAKVRKLTTECETLMKRIVTPESLPEKKYQTIVIDPPWPVKKIARDERPNQDIFEYPTMTIEEIMDSPLGQMADNDAHLYLWTTQRFLPDAIRVMRGWGFNYQCLLTWVKPTGMTPYSWMYSTEHVLFGKRGSLKLLKLGERLDFTAPTTGHSRKPDKFYDIVKTVSPGPRIDVFSREKRDGFDQFGNEKDKFNGDKLAA